MSIVIIVLLFPAINASASQILYSANDVAGKKGETVTVVVKIATSSKIWGSNVSLAYDSTELEYVSSSKGDAVSNGSLHNTGSAVNFSGAYGNSGDIVFTVKFKVLKDSGTYTLKLTSTENIDYNGKEYSCATKNGSVTALNTTTILGDVTGDGKVTATDARMLLQSVAGLKTINNKQTALSDVNKDGVATASDARLILRIIAGLK